MRVTRKAVRRQHVHAREELVEVRGDDVLEGHEARLVRVGVGRLDGGRAGRGLLDGDEPRQQRRHLDAGEVLLLRLGVADDDREVQRQARDVGERVGRVDRQRREHREDLVAEHLVQPVLLVLGQARPTARR
ncbi:hypothetical protein GCM10025868_28140 [Angustibacter aerolatus]|uniref:Uncharacterized protein n=1 Tax=Angustibacter aerolatus TaxID=1162965 RepID=A0ABQ6JJJ6_9ACTN|nr:hypothetical protein GCM10025868_28140 [Angustibacter aerolatus]